MVAFHQKSQTMIRFFPWLRIFTLGVPALVAWYGLCAQPNGDMPVLSRPSLPFRFTYRLDSLRQKNNLEEWLYTWMAFVRKAPASRVAFMTAARSGIWRECLNDAERLAWFYFLDNEGYFQLYTGNILRSIEAYEQAYRFYFDKPVAGADVLEYVLKPLGNNYTRLGDYDRAFFIQEKSLSIAQKQGDMQQVAAIYNNLAISARWKGDLKQALQFAENGLQPVKKNSVMNGLLLSTLADILFQSGEIKEAEIKAKEAIRLLRQNLRCGEINAPYWLESAYQVNGNVLKMKGALQASLQAYREAGKILDRFYKGQRKREKAKLLVLRGDVLLQLRQPKQAIEKFSAALAVLLPGLPAKAINALPPATQLYGENTLMDALNGKANCLMAMNRKERALQCYLLLFTVEKKLRQEFYSTAARQQLQKENRQWEESAIATAYDLWRESGRKAYADQILLIAEMSKSQLLLDEMMSNLQYNRMKNRDTLLTRQLQIMQAVALYEREAILGSRTDKQHSNAEAIKKELQYNLSLISKQVKEKYPVLGGYLGEEQGPSAANLLQHIPSNTTVVEFFTGENSIYIIQVKKGSVQHIRKPENAILLLQAIKDFSFNWFQQGPQKMMNHPQQYYKEAYALYHWIWEGTGIEKGDRCLVIPDNTIGYLPFDALVTDPVYRPDIGRWPFLIRNTDLFYSYSLQTWQQQQGVRRDNQLFAGFFISFDSSRKASLPAVKKEYSAIHDIVDGKYYTEQAATATVFRRILDRVNLLHISTHSFLQGEESMPVLQLANDRFFLFELYGQAFQPQLVVLSACRTGEGMLVKGEGIISLARGFTAAGAGGIVAGLWNMHDESTAELMGEFYQHLTKLHQPADALHASKLQWLSQPKEENFKKLPYFWAGLIYVGDNQTVKIATINKRMPVFPMTGALLATSAIFLMSYLFLKKRKKNRTVK
jgi:CHAT domain-containing protein